MVTQQSRVETEQNAIADHCHERLWGHSTATHYTCEVYFPLRSGCKAKEARLALFEFPLLIGKQPHLSFHQRGCWRLWWSMNR